MVGTEASRAILLEETLQHDEPQQGMPQPSSYADMTEIARDAWIHSRVEWGTENAVEVIGRDAAFEEIHRKARKIAAFDEPVLITGESGVGKESLAQMLYLLSPRRGKPFISVNCPQYQEGNLTVSELFGHKRGSFTGATADRKGCFETADGGVVFLDEIGDLHMSAQVMLLRALASGEFQPLGSDSKRRVNVRVIAATNRPLDQLRVGGQFRNDLFFRLRYFLLNLSPLRERQGDWQLLFRFFLGRLASQHGVEKHLSPAAVSLLGSYSWPGNIRELSSVATMGYAMASGVSIEPNDFQSLLEEDASPAGDLEGGDPYLRMVLNGESFWKVVREPFMQRDLKRSEVRSTLCRGLAETQGSYRGLLPLFSLADSDYQRFMDFLRHHRLKP